MTETPSTGDREKRRERPTHWDHPVDEQRREARVRRHRLRRVWVLVAILGVAALAGSYFYLTSDKRVEARSEAYLEKLLGTRVAIGRASFSWSEGLVIEDLRIMASAAFKEPLLTAQRVHLRIKPLSLLLSDPEVTEIIVYRPHINLVQNKKGKWNFQTLERTQPLAAMGHARPVISLESGAVRVEWPYGGAFVAERRMQVSGLLLPSETDPNMFRFQTDVTYETAAKTPEGKAAPAKTPEGKAAPDARTEPAHLAVASGLIDTRTGTLRFEGQASNVALARELYESLPPEAQRIWRRFEPTGSVNVKVTFSEKEKEGFQLATDLTGVSFTQEYEGREYRFENLTGRCDYSPTGLHLKGVQGLVNGIPIRLEGDVTGFDTPRLGLDLKVSADRVSFEESRESLTALAPVIGTVYQTYLPKGQFEATMKVRRAPAADAPIEVTGDASFREVEMTYIGFPYRLQRMHGSVKFSPQGYETSDVEGYHGQALVRLQGWAKSALPGGEFQMRILGTNVPLDEDLRAALSTEYRRVYDQYKPGGTADAEVLVSRGPADAKPVTTIHLTLKDCQFCYAGFPYPLTGATGRVNIEPTRTEIIDVRGRHGQAKVVFSGEIAAGEDPKAPPKVTLRVTGEDVALDEDLANALPERDRAVLEKFHLSGMADIDGTVTAGPETKDRLDYDLTVRLKGARMIYEPFPFLAEQVTGQLRLARGSCRIESITGYNAGARIEARGWIDQRPDDYAMDLVLAGTDVVLGESLRGALGPEMRTAWSHLAPRGRVDVSAHLTKALGSAETVKHHVWVTARDAQATVDVFPYPLEHVTGQLEFEGAEVRLHGVKARTGLTEFGLDGTISYRPEGPQVDLTLQTRGLRFEGPLRDALPAPLQKAFDILHPTGRIDLNPTILRYRPLGPGKSEASWSGSAILDEVGMEPGLKLAGLVGTVEMEGRWAEGKTALSGRLRIQQGKVADMDISETRLLIEKSADASTVSLRSVEGEIYGGRMEGSAAIRIDPSSRYALNLAATDVDFERFLREGLRIQHNITGGKMRATLGLWTRPGESKHGAPGEPAVYASGYVDVTDARLYELPLMVRVLNALRFAPADRTAFEKARVLYFWRGKRLILGDIRLEGRAVSLYGAGVLEPNGQLSMTFLTGKHNDDPLIPALSELMEGIRRELVVVLVSGTLAEPQVEMRTLSNLGAPLRELITLVREQRQREAAARR